MVSLGYFSLPKQREEHKERPFSQEIPGQARDEARLTECSGDRHIKEPVPE